MDGEATRIDTQSNGIIDKREGNKRQQTCQYQQNDTDFAQIVIHAIHQILLVSDVTYLGIFLQFTLYPLQRIAIGIVSFQVHLYRAEKRVGPDKLRGVGPHGSRLLLERLLFADKMNLDRKSVV